MGKGDQRKGLLVFENEFQPYRKPTRPQWASICLDSRMPGINTTRSEAFERSTLLSVLSYEVSLDLTTAVDTFYAKTEVRFLSNQVGAKTFIDVVAKELISATLNGRNLDTSAFDGETLFLDQLEVENFLTIEALAKYTNTGEGLHKFTDPADGEVYLYTQFETADARRMYACFDQPDLKATFDLDVIAPSHWQVISNQAATLINPTGDNQLRQPMRSS